MIPSEVIEIADLMVPDGWRDTTIEDDVLKAAWRVYNAGYRKQEQETDPVVADGWLPDGSWKPS